MLFKSTSKLLGVIAMVVTVGLGGSSTAYASPPFDGGDSSCQADTSSCYLYHFKLDGNTHKMAFTILDGVCGDQTSNFTVWRKNSANIWLDARRTSFFYINFDDNASHVTEGMKAYRCDRDGIDRMRFLNNENKCWYLWDLRTRGHNCDWH